MWYVYILRSRTDHNTYVGLTNDLRNRFLTHNKGKVFSTKSRKPLDLIYYEAHLEKSDVVLRERFLKTGWGKNWIKRTLRNYFRLKKVGRTS